MARKRTSFGFLFWVAFVLLIIIIFLANKSDIDRVVEKTEIIEIIKKKLNGDNPLVTDEEPAKEPADDLSREPSTKPSDGQSSEEPEAPPEEIVVVAPDIKSLDSESENRSSEDTSSTGKSIEADEEPKETSSNPADDKPNLRRASLYFVEVTEDGRLNPRPVNRVIKYKDNPMTETLISLLKGPSTEELNSGILSLIPTEAELISAWVKEDTAFLNFNEAFRFNELGVEGYNAQLKQIVYSTTEFSNVKSVQFLVEGNLRDFLGPEGPYIGKPISRKSLENL